MERNKAGVCDECASGTYQIVRKRDDRQKSKEEGIEEKGGLPGSVSTVVIIICFIHEK
jgi:hypothetical protein